MSTCRPPVLPPRHRIRTLMALAALLALGACSDMHRVRDQANPGPYGHGFRVDAEAARSRIGTVQSIEIVRIAHSSRSGGTDAPAQTSDAYRVMVRMHDGSYQSLTQTTGVQLQVGDRVQVANGVAQPY